MDKPPVAEAAGLEETSVEAAVEVDNPIEDSELDGASVEEAAELE